MKKNFLFLLLFLILNFLLPARKCFAEQNIFGLHLTQTSDINPAAKIINSSGGNWGWVTIVLRTDILDKNSWQDFMDNCRKYHLIPIVRLATTMKDNHWKKPEISDIDNLTNFLNSLNWPTTQQHVILFNEINHASEWGGEIDSKSYTDLSIYAAQKLKTLNSNFYILSSGLDLAAGSSADTKPAADIYREIYAYKPKYFDNIDGLASHSYPNHGFVGTPNDTGQHSIRGYQWELNFIKSLGVNKTYPVFITETGWPHREGESKNNQFYTAETSAKFLNNALDIWSQDSRIQAVTPFIFNYPYPPFDHFSWLNQAETIYPAYQQITSRSKSSNYPSQTTKYELVNNRLPFLLFANNDYSGQITLKNIGQSVWGETNFCLTPETTQNVTLDTICTDNGLVYPGQTETFNYKLKINNLADYRDKTFISWQNLPQIEIKPLNGSGSIYSPKITPRQRLIQIIQGFFL